MPREDNSNKILNYVSIFNSSSKSEDFLFWTMKNFVQVKFQIIRNQRLFGAKECQMLSFQKDIKKLDFIDEFIIFENKTKVLQVSVNEKKEEIFGVFQAHESPDQEKDRLVCFQSINFNFSKVQMKIYLEKSI